MTDDDYRAERNRRADELERLAAAILDPAAGESAAWIVTGWPDGHTCREWLMVRPADAGRRLADAARAARLITSTSGHADHLNITP